MIRFIAIDLDDTLLDKKKNISFQNRQAIQKAIANHIYIVIASGRPYFRVKPILEQLNMVNGDNYVITFNGGVISNATNQLLVCEKRLSNQDIQNIFTISKRYDLCCMVYQGNQIYSVQLEPSILRLPVYQGIDFTFQNHEKIGQIAYAHKIIFASEEEKIKRYKQNVISELGKTFTIVQSTPNFLEILPLNTSKGEAIQTLAKSLGITKEEIMVIGDAENDVSMFEVAHVKVAMANAISDLKQKATFITKSCEEDGVAYAIFHILQGDKHNE